MKNTDKHKRKNITQIRIFFISSQKMEKEIFAVCTITFERSWRNKGHVTTKETNRIKFVIPMH